MTHTKDTTRQIRYLLMAIDASTDDRYHAVDQAFREIEGLARKGRREVQRASYQAANPTSKE